MNKGKTIDFDELHKLANRGNAEACFEIAESYYYQKNYSDAFQWYKKTVACKNPNPVAYFNIAYVLQFGEGTKMDIAASLDFYQKAVTYELPQAMYNLAFFYQNGIIVPKDTEKAERLCREATLKLNELQNKLDKSQREYDRLTENYLALIKLVDDANVRTKVLESKRTQIELKAESLQKENNSLKNECIQYKNQLKSTENQNSSLMANNQKLEKNLADFRNIVLDKDNLINALNKQIAELHKNIDELTDKYVKINRSMEQLNRENKVLQNDLKNAKTEKESLLFRNSQLSGQLEIKETAYNDLLQQYLSLIESHSKLKSELEIVKKDKKQLEEKVLQETKKKDAVFRSLEQTKNDCSIKEKKLNDKIHELMEIKQKLSVTIGVLSGGLGISLIVLIIFLFH